MESIVRELPDLAIQKGIRERAVHARLYFSDKYPYSLESERPTRGPCARGAAQAAIIIFTMR